MPALLYLLRKITPGPFPFLLQLSHNRPKAVQRNFQNATVCFRFRSKLAFHFVRICNLSGHPT